MTQLQSISSVRIISQRAAVIGLTSALGLLLATPALAHHPSGGQTPTSAIEGFLSGLGHPVVGLDHLAFVITAGLLAAIVGRRLLIPIVFVLASLGGTGLHLAGANLPAPEFCISASVLVFGILLAMRQQPQPLVVSVLAAIAGIFHGYAYGEAVVGAEVAPMLAYLLGFAAIQMAIAGMAFGAAKRLVSAGANGALNLRFAGFALAGVGAAFLSSIVLG